MRNQIVFFIRELSNANANKESNTLSISHEVADELKENILIDFSEDKNVRIKQTSYSYTDIDTLDFGTIQMSVEGLKFTKLRFVKADGANDFSTIFIKLQKEGLDIILDIFEADANKAEQLAYSIDYIKFMTTNHC